MRIQKYVFTGSRPVFKDQTAPIKYWVDVQPDQIEIRVSSLAEHKTVDPETGTITTEIKPSYMYWDIIKLSELQKRPGFVDQTLWTRLNEEHQPAMKDDEGEYYPNILSNSLIVDMFSQGLISKPGEMNNHLTNYSDSLYSIFVPNSTSDCTTFVVRLFVDPKYEGGYEFEGPAIPSIDVIEPPQTLEELMSPITLSSVDATVQADSSVLINVTSDPFIDEIWLEQVYGLLNKTRVKLTNGQGSFTAFSTGLEAGEVIRVKAGHRKFSGLADITIPVV